MNAKNQHKEIYKLPHRIAWHKVTISACSSAWDVLALMHSP